MTENHIVILPGRSAEEWSRGIGPFVLSSMLLAVIFVPAYVLSGATAATAPIWLYALFVVMLLLFFAGMFVFLAAAFKAMREAKAGYTTTGGQYPNLPQLESRTGVVIRPAPTTTSPPPTA
ncbi:hypothetical protein [Cryobacterium sp. CG_9.6]|uniref:hypothetical protein n=1 Tax=Cryobacterium sp. CG_9.6 TaxID=2760710 RepID=UPI002473ECA0|nr:hypothetical protein [Cryobacterium sp. CG_9.6]MDH6238544.1 hypothetical protein [Cryobacterium sp. CG_9.6]